MSKSKVEEVRRAEFELTGDDAAVIIRMNEDSVQIQLVVPKNLEFGAEDEYTPRDLAAMAAVFLSADNEFIDGLRQQLLQFMKSETENLKRGAH